tara:strand:+ start:3900 stop:4613 length:714 start_codon:yes stop_codon:yes gene_type:complete
MKKIFCSGSCRLLLSIEEGREKLISIHSTKDTLDSHIFLGKLHNTKQHIQFIKFINDNIIIPENIVCKFLTRYNDLIDKKYDCFTNIIKTKHNLKKNFFSCDFYIFEICSIKLYKKNSFEVQNEFTNDYKTEIQTNKDLYNDLAFIRKIIPQEKKILFQVHFRPNIIYQEKKLKILNREIIYKTVKKFCNNHKNTFIHDPSLILQIDKNLFNGLVHFTKEGYLANFNFIYENYIKNS